MVSSEAPPPDAPAASAKPEAAPESTPPPAPVDLVKAAVTPENAARRELFTWTTREQLALLRKHRRLLFRSRGSDGSRSMYGAAVEDLDDPVTRMLRDPEFVNKRFAWANPWGTALGWGPGARYGDVLVRVVLKAEAVIAFMTIGVDVRPIWSFFTTAGKPVSQSDVLSHPQRVAAVFHENATREEPYREYVLVNESMIARWEATTPGVAATLRGQAAQLERWRGVVDNVRPQTWTATVSSSWRQAGPSALSQYAATLALSSEHYRPRALPELAKALRAAAEVPGPELVVSPRVGFGAPLPAALRPKPKPLPRCSDPTFCP